MMDNETGTDHSRRPRSAILALTLLAALTLLGHAVTRFSGDDGVVHASPVTHAFHGPGGQPISVQARLDRGSVLAGGDGEVRMELILEAPPSRTAAHRLPTDFIVVLDRSGSMGGDKIEHARAAVLGLIDELANEDRLAVVTYASDARLSISLAAASPAAKATWRGLVAAVVPGGGTNMSRGLDLALELFAARQGDRPSRMLLVSDGLANEGDSSREGLTGRATTASRREVVLSPVGVGIDFDEFTLSAIADAGSGNYYYLESGHRLAAVLDGEFAASRETVASGVSVAVTPGDGVRLVDAAGYPLRQIGPAAMFYPGTLFAGQERRIWLTFQVPAAAPGQSELGDIALAYTAAGERFAANLLETPVVACVASEDSFFESVDRQAWERSVVEEEYGRLRQAVAGLVKRGEKEAALAEISAYRVENEALNDSLRSDAVSRNLGEVDALERELEAAFEGSNQMQKQNRFSKSQQAAGWDQRRAGAKRAGSRKASDSPQQATN